MNQQSPSTLSFELLFIAGLMREVENGDTTLSSEQACSIAESLYSIAEECASLEQALAVARRWAHAHDFPAIFARHVAIREGVRAGRVIDLVSILEREMAQNAARRGGAA